MDSSDLTGNTGDVIIDEGHLSTALRADEFNSVMAGHMSDPRYVGLNRAQRRKAMSHERKAAKHGRI